MQKVLSFLVRIGILSDNGLYYIGGSDVLPPPLKGEAEQQALDALERGEEDARQLLVEHNLRLVVSCWWSITCGWWSTLPGGLKIPG